MENNNRLTIGKKMYLFVIATVLLATACVCVLNYVINVDQINTYYKRLTINNAKNYSTLIDVEFLKELRAMAETDEYQALREQAEADDVEAVIEEYLKEQGIYDKFIEEREKMRTYVNNMEDVEYLYAIVWNEDTNPDGATYDMYLIDADDVPLYMIGYWEEREEEFDGVDYKTTIPPTISHGDWGWLCSGYEPLYDENGKIICHVGVDIEISEMMQERYSDLGYMVISALVVMVIAVVFAVIFVRKNVVNPLKEITADIKRFSPSAGKDYVEAGVTNICIKSDDEIGDIYKAIKRMQERQVDYINDITAFKQVKEEAEVVIKEKDQQIGEIRKEAYRDALTGIGSKAAYVRKENELNEAICKGYSSFAVVMMDANGLKYINDNYGHVQGDAYLKGCSHIICEEFKHSPVFRIGGDEFVAILSGEDYQKRDERVEALRKVFDTAYKNEEAQPWERYSASVGMAEFTSEDKTVDDVFKRADKLMYENKVAFKKTIASES